MVWGSSSSLTQATVVPTGTDTSAGMNLRFFMVTCIGPASAPQLSGGVRRRTSPTAPARHLASGFIARDVSLYHRRASPHWASLLRRARSRMIVTVSLLHGL